MKLEAVTVCVNYSDFLAHTLPHNINFFDRYVVITSPEDKATQDLCNKWDVDYETTTVFQHGGDTFNKARGINLGLSHLRQDGWLLHLDADVLLPHRFKSMLAKAELDESCIYGADRLNVKGYAAYQKLLADQAQRPQHEWRYLVNPQPWLTVGSRLVHPHYAYAPCGYFQLWHGSARHTYPVNQGTAEHTDILFSVKWPRQKRILIPEFFVYHLESDDAGFGTNWQGRKSAPFVPYMAK